MFTIHCQVEHIETSDNYDAYRSPPIGPQAFKIVWIKTIVHAKITLHCATGTNSNSYLPQQYSPSSEPEPIITMLFHIWSCHSRGGLLLLQNNRAKKHNTNCIPWPMILASPRSNPPHCNPPWMRTPARRSQIYSPQIQSPALRANLLLSWYRSESNPHWQCCDSKPILAENHPLWSKWAMLKKQQEQQY